MDRVLAYSWPGNVRELEHAIARAVLLGRGTEATPQDLPAIVTQEKPARSAMSFGDDLVPVREVQRRYAAWVLERVGGRKMLACEKLGIDAKTLNKWLATDDGSSD
jgi:two-component system response regulator HydG